MIRHSLVDSKSLPGATDKIFGNLMNRVMRNLGRQSLAKVFDSLQDGLSDYAKATDSYVQGLDEHTASIVKQLAGAVNQLEDVLSEFSEEVVERT